MTIHIEFFGVARQRAGVACTSLPLAGPVTLQTVLLHLGAEYPDFAAECLQGNRLQSNYVANVNGHQFVRDTMTELSCTTRIQRGFPTGISALVNS